MNERGLKSLLDSAPVDELARERAWQVVEAAFAEREPSRRRPARPGRTVLVLAAVAAAVAAAALSPPGRAVVNAVRRSIGIEHAQPALFRLPAPGRLLVAGGGGAWVVAEDGSKRRLGDYGQAAWSPHALYVVAAGSNELAAVTPGGVVRWTLARPGIRLPRWGGTRTDTRIAYLTAGRLRVVAGDGSGDREALRPAPAPGVAPVWQPTAADRHVLAYATAGGRVIVFASDSRTVRWTSAAYPGPRALAWSPDGTQLALAAQRGVVLFDARSGRATILRVRGVQALAYAPDGRLALLRSRDVLLRAGGAVHILFVPPGGRLSGLAWSPNGRWLLTELPAADEWVFLQTLGGRRILAVSHIRAQFGAFPSLSGWAG